MKSFKIFLSESKYHHAEYNYYISRQKILDYWIHTPLHITSITVFHSEKL